MIFYHVVRNYFMQNPELKRSTWKQYIIAGIFAGGLYSLAAFFFIRSERFESTWWLYAGNGFFMVAVCLYCLKRTLIDRVRESSMKTVISGHLVTVAGIIVSCIIGFLLILIFVAGIFGLSETTNQALVAVPPTMTHSNTHGLLFIFFANATFGNFIAGSFISVLTGYSVERRVKRIANESKKQ